MLTLIYNNLLFLLFVALLPKILYQYFFLGKYRKSFIGRLGQGFDFATNGKKLIWIHAPSLGETKAIAMLAKRIKEKTPDSYLLITSTTETGHEEAKKSISIADNHLFMPFDFGWLVRPIVRRLCPSLVILCESDFWYNFLDECKACGASVFLANGKLSLKSLHRYLKVPFFTKRLFSRIDLFCLQSDRYFERFVSLGIPKEKLIVTGNIKFDNPVTSSKDVDLLKQKLRIAEDELVIVAGSTHDPEEEIILKTLAKIWENSQRIKLILVPRHPERFNEVAKRIPVPFARYSEMEKGSGAERVILIDAVGILKACYQLCDVAFVGGSFTEKVGGHNILEPCSYAKPVIYGQHMHTQLDLVDFMNEFKAGIQTTPEQFFDVLTTLLASEEKRKGLGEGGLKLIKAMQGASERTFSTICNNFIF